MDAVDFSNYLSLFLFISAVWWIAGAFAVMVAALNRGRSGGSWLAMSLLLGPILTALLLIAYPTISQGSSQSAAPL